MSREGVGVSKKFSSLVTLAWFLAHGCGQDSTVAGIDMPSALDSSCEGAVPFEAGMERVTESGLTVRLDYAAPAPPDVGDNYWTIGVFNDAGDALDVPTVVKPWMPLHGHGTTPPSFEGAAAEQGTYEIEPFNLFMPGLWEFTVNVGSEDMAADEVVFAFCVEG